MQKGNNHILFYRNVENLKHVKQQPAVVHFSLGGGGRVHHRQTDTLSFSSWAWLGVRERGMNGDM